MIGGDQFGAAEVEPFAAKAGNSLGGLEQRLGGAAAQGADYFWLITAIWRIRNGEQVAISSFSGRRFSGGRHFTTLQM